MAIRRKEIRRSTTVEVFREELISKFMDDLFPDARGRKKLKSDMEQVKVMFHTGDGRSFELTDEMGAVCFEIVTKQVIPPLPVPDEEELSRKKGKPKWNDDEEDEEEDEIVEEDEDDED